MAIPRQDADGDFCVGIKTYGSRYKNTEDHQESEEKEHGKERKGD